MSGGKRKFVLPAAVLLAAAAGSLWLAAGSAPPSAANAAPLPVVKVVSVSPQRLRLPVHSQGVLQPVREIDLTSEAGGRVEAVAAGFVAGGRFRAGDVLVKLAGRAYDLAVVRAETQLAEAKRKLAEEQAAAQQARREWQVLGQGKPTPLSLREPQLQEAAARLKQAEAELADAKFLRSRCEIRAPFSGRVKEKRVGTGQTVEPGQALGRIYADAAAEVRLPLNQTQIGYLPDAESGATVWLSAERGVRRQARIVRREGMVDAATGLEYWVARLEEPERDPALLPGTFLSAEIEGRELDGVFELPRAALNAAQEAVLVVAGDTLQIRRLPVLRSDAERVWIGGGLQAGDRVVVSGLDAPVAGQRVVVETGDAER
ncbi:efflux RND transporter periplasmic adaptor subunit [Methylomonas sp. HYX-M1]|uniref:efflux RND transporter periplasmic adaptor subunit n=1 Tax=Methylomonas sp. HYX-M1 TaxID=3139307 RepID=UPI00345B5988